MSRICPVTFKKDMTGNNVSHAHNKTLRLFKVNLRPATFYSHLLRRDFHLRLSTKGIKTLEKYGGIDGFVKAMPLRRLSCIFKKIRQEIDEKKL